MRQFKEINLYLDILAPAGRNVYRPRPRTTNRVNCVLYPINGICPIFQTVGAVLRCTHPNAICIPNRTDRLESS